jgi:ATP-binding cassette, subfamily F, member 3
MHALGYNVSIGYFAQNQAQLLDGELTVLETLEEVAVGPVRTKAAHHSGRLPVCRR